MIDWDAYRAAYDGMGPAEQAAFYARVWELHPDQRHFDADACGRLLDAAAPASVQEVGGWRGELAAAVLPSRPGILSWRNREVCEGAASHPACADPRYSLGLGPADALVMSHVIEHMRLREAEAYVEAVRPRAAFVQSPLSEDGQDWAGYRGSHVLREGWREVEAMMARHGLRREPALDAPDVRCFL